MIKENRCEVCNNQIALNGIHIHQPEYIHLNDISLKILGYETTIEEKNCFIGDDDYHFKYFYKNGEYHFSISSYYEALDFNEIVNTRIEMGRLIKIVEDWFDKDREYNWDVYSGSNVFGYFDIRSVDSNTIEVVGSQVLVRH